MRVYEVNTGGKPEGGKFPSYASLGIKPGDVDFLFGGDAFCGKPFQRKWRPLEFYVYELNYPRADIWSMGACAWVVNSRAMLLAGEAFEMAGELLPVSVDGETQDFSLFNCTHCPNVLDLSKSKWHFYGPEKEFKQLAKPSFIADRFGEVSLFKIMEHPVCMYCLERTGDPEDAEFKALVEQHALAGVEFKMVWEA